MNLKYLASLVSCCVRSVVFTGSGFFRVPAPPLQSACLNVMSLASMF